MKPEILAALSGATKDLAAAQDAFASADREESVARSRRTDALNRLNAAQRAFIAAAEEVAKAQPPDSDIGRSRRERPRAVA